MVDSVASLALPYFSAWPLENEVMVGTAPEPLKVQKQGYVASVSLKH